MIKKNIIYLLYKKNDKKRYYKFMKIYTNLKSYDQISQVNVYTFSQSTCNF